MELRRLQRPLRGMLMGIGFLLALCACSTTPIAVETKTILIAPPDELLISCNPERVKEDTVRALAHGYVVNTYEVWKCNARLEALREWKARQQELQK